MLCLYFLIKSWQHVIALSFDRDRYLLHLFILMIHNNWHFRPLLDGRNCTIFLCIDLSLPLWRGRPCVRFLILLFIRLIVHISDIYTSSSTFSCLCNLLISIEEALCLVISCYLILWTLTLMNQIVLVDDLWSSIYTHKLSVINLFFIRSCTQIITDRVCIFD